MRVLFTSALVAALVSAGGAPPPSGNTAKRHTWGNTAPHRFDVTKTLIASGTTEDGGNPGAGQLDLRVVLQAADADRATQELHTTLTLSGITLTNGQELYMGWAYRPSSAADIEAAGGPCPEAATSDVEVVCVGAQGDKLDNQGTTRSKLIERAGGATGWDGVSYMKVYDSSVPESVGGWTAQEIWVDSAEAPDLATAGIGALTVTPDNAFMVNDEFSSMTADGGAVESDRVWDFEDSGTGYAITNVERAFDFIGWYAVYDPTPCGRRLLQEEGTEVTAVPAKDWATVCLTQTSGQSEDPQIFVLGALNGLAVASVAILTSMLF